jgi:hypothetical protein
VKRCFRVIMGFLLFLLAATSLSADTLQDIDAAVSKLGEFLLKTIPDATGQNLTILPFLSDEHGRVTLGDRLKSELELYLAAEYKRLRIIPQPEGGNTYTISGELQSYPGRVRIICRVTKPDGSLGAGTRIDIPSSPELLSLLEPATVTQPGSEQALRGFQGGSVDQELADPFEPDDAPGFEVQVPSFGTQSYGRAISRGDVDRFRFYKSGEGTVVLEARADFDLQLLLFREGENIPFQVSGSEMSENIRLETKLEEGYYIVELLAYDFSVEGPYAFSIDLTGRSNDGFEPDNRFEDAKAIYPDSKQDRALLSGDQDWVELSFTVPSFYAIYTTGQEVDTAITVYTDRQREILQDDDSGVGENAYIPLFLGTQRSYAAVTGDGPGGSYTLTFEKIDPLQIFPASGVEDVQIEEIPLSLRLRIIQTGRYSIRAGGQAAAVSADVFSLPSMRPVRGAESLYSLTAGDYLLVLKSDQAQRISYCVAPESAAEECRSSIPHQE